VINVRVSGPVTAAVYLSDVYKVRAVTSQSPVGEVIRIVTEFCLADGYKAERCFLL
jgi:vacuolar-type H+-ATPase catalytic subunit A/Vma1